MTLWDLGSYDSMDNLAQWNRCAGFAWRDEDGVRETVMPPSGGRSVADARRMAP